MGFEKSEKNMEHDRENGREVFAESQKDNYTQRNRFTRMCIGQALISLLDEKEFSKIRVQEIADRAGVSRMTYYQYYHDKIEVLDDYLEDIISQYLNTCQHSERVGEFGDYEHVLHALLYFDQYALFLQKLKEIGFYSLIVSKINAFVLEHIPKNQERFVYEAYYYAGGLLNVFMKWEEDGKQVPASDIAAMVTKSKKNKLQCKKEKEERKKE